MAQVQAVHALTASCLMPQSEGLAVLQLGKRQIIYHSKSWLMIEESIVTEGILTKHAKKQAHIQRYSASVQSAMC